MSTPIVGLLVGSVLGFWLGHSVDALAGGALVGIVAGLIIDAWRKKSASAANADVDTRASRLAALEERLARVEAALDRAGLSLLAPAIAPQAKANVPPATPIATPSRASIATPPPAPAYGAARATRESNRVWTWITVGNTPARVGIVVLFIGAAF